MITRGEITGVILCGGDARRMFGVEKPLQLMDGEPLVAHVRARVSPQVAHVVISANREHDAYAVWGDPVVSDDITGAGPLAGLVRALRAVDTPYAFCCPGDAPRIDPALVARLAHCLDETSGGADICVPHDGDRAQHLFLLLRTAEQDALEQYLVAGGRAVHAWLATRRVAVCDASDIAGSFLNINTEQDLLLASRHSPADSPHHQAEPL